MKLYFYDKSKGHKRYDTDKMIRESLSAYTQEHSLTRFDGTIQRTSLGKPYIDYPLFIGVTHTDDIVIIGVDETAFGIDCEDICRKISRRQSIEKRFFTENERLFIESSADKDKAFLETWVKKEAYVKFCGEGFSGLSKCDVTSLSGFERIENDKNLIIYIYREIRD